METRADCRVQTDNVGGFSLGSEFCDVKFFFSFLLLKVFARVMLL